MASWWALIQFKSLFNRSFRSTSVEDLQAMDVGSWLAKSSAGEERKSESCVIAKGLEKHLLVKIASFVEKLTITQGNPNKKGLDRFGTILNQKIEFGQLLFTKVSPFSDRKVELNVHDPNPLELDDLVPEVATHPANLPI